MSAAAKGIPLIVSRRALQRLSKKYPQHLKEKIRSTPKKDDVAWPAYMRRAGYSAIAFAVPYSICMAIAESPSVRDTLEGDPGSDDSDSIGRKVVNFVRWYWGQEDKIPYAEYLAEDEHNEVSLPSDVSSVERANEENIQRMLRDEIRVHVETEVDGQERFGTVDGRMPSSDVEGLWKKVGMENEGSSDVEPQIVYLSFEDDENNNDEDGMNSDLSTANDVSGTVPSKQITNLTTIWSAWSNFGNAQNTEAADVTFRAPIDPYEMRIEQLKLEIVDIANDLKDPYCLKDRDQMHDDMKMKKKEVRSLKMQRRIDKLKNIFRKSR